MNNFSGNFLKRVRAYLFKYCNSTSVILLIKLVNLIRTTRALLCDFK